VALRDRIAWICCAVAVFAGAGVAALLSFRRPAMALDEVVEESYPLLEWTEVGVWIVIALVCAWGALRMPTWRLALLAGWLGLLALLATVRELDLHVVLNPANIHLIGLDESQAVRFRLDWWTDAETSVPLRLAWGSVFLVAGGALVLPFALGRYPWFSRLLARDAFPVLLALGVGLLGVCYIADDFVGRPLARAGYSVGLFEETGELLGQLFILAGVVVFARRRGGPRLARSEGV
jgi:hypothetical protein